MAESRTSILNKLADVSIVDKEFTNTENGGEIVEYKRIVLTVIIDGEEQEIEAVPARAEGKSAYSVLKLADNVEA